MFKKIWKFIVGFAVGIVPALLFFRRGNKQADNDIERLQFNINRLTENIRESERIISELKSTNAELREQLESGSTELRFEVEQLRLENSRISRELEQRIKQARTTLSELGSEQSGQQDILNRLERVNSEFASFIKENTK